MILTEPPARPIVLALVLALSGTIPGCSGGHRGPNPAFISDEPLATALDDSRGSATGRVVDAPANLTDFAPADSSVHVDAATVNLRRVFEDIGDDATLWYQHVQTLANPFFEGRAPETRGADLAADYIQFWFEHYGLEPAFPASEETGESGAWTSYRQPFRYTRRGAPEVRVKAAALELGDRTFQEQEDFVVLGNSGTGELRAPVTFVGYAVAEGPGGYTSFEEDTDLTGRVALMLRYTPLDEQGEARWDEEAAQRHGGLRRKMKAVADRGAEAVILVNPPQAVQAPRNLESIRRSRMFGPELGIPVVQVTGAAADEILAAADPEGHDLAAWRALADRGSVRSVDLSDDARVSIRADVERKRTDTELTGQNVGGVLRGQGDLADEWVVIGAHHDHVGLGRHGGVMPGNRGRMHPGADDNASGTAGVLVLARMLSEAYAETRRDLRSVLFLTFDAEEMGLHGSRHFAEHTPIRPEQMTLLLNMDMIGRLRSGNLSVLGTATGEGLAEMLEPHFLSSGLTVSVNGAGSGRSDDANFHDMSVPALHFFTGMHPDYTSPADQAYTVNPAGARLVLGLMLDIALDAASRPERLRYREPPPDRGQNRGYGRVRLGILPDMGAGEQEGVLIDRVSEGTSADDAGLRGGDRIVAWDGHPVRGLADLFGHLQTHEPGDRVKLTVERDGRRIEVGVTLKAGEG